MNNSKKNILFVSYAFPPVNVVGAVRPFCLCKYLPSYGWKPIVVSRRVWDGASIDNNLSLPADNPTEVYRCRDIWDIPFLRSRIIGWLLRPVFIPDEFVFWNISVFFQTLKLIIFKHIDEVICTVPPVSSFFGVLGAAKLARKPFIADFRDLWTLHEYFETKTTSGFRKKLEGYLEKFIMACADLVILNTGIAKEKMGKKYPSFKSKFITITNGVDFDNASDVSEASFDKFTITYTGSFYLDRNPSFFLECLSDWLYENPNIKDKIQIIFAGKNVQSCHSLIVKYGLSGVVRLYDQLPKKDVYKYQMASHILLIFLGFRSESDYVMPAKLYEYMAFNKPVLAFVPADGTADRLIKDLKIGITVNGENKKIVKDALNIYYQKYSQGKFAIKAENFPNEYDYSNIVKRFSEKMLILAEKSL